MKIPSFVTSDVVKIFLLFVVLILAFTAALKSKNEEEISQAQYDELISLMNTNQNCASSIKVLWYKDGIVNFKEYKEMRKNLSRCILKEIQIYGGH
jgi:hypothetical protein